MAYWNIIYDCIREIDDKNLRIYVNVYDFTDESQILVFDDWNSEKEFAKMLKQRMENIPEVKQDVEDAIYDVSDREDWWIEEAVGGWDYWTFSDEGYVCSECYKWHFFDNHGACSYQNYYCGDGWIVCEDCLRENDEYKDIYIKELIDNPDRANTIFSFGEFIDFGFDKVNDWPYENGWYGRMDNPKKILEKAKNLFPDCEFIFSIRKTYNPWETEFDLYRREIA